MKSHLTSICQMTQTEVIFEPVGAIGSDNLSEVTPLGF